MSAASVKMLGKRQLAELRQLALEGGDVETALATILAEKRERKRRYQAEWRQKNPEKQRAQKKRYRKKHRAQINARSRERNREAPEVRAASRERTKQARKAGQVLWLAKNNDKARKHYKDYRQRTKAVVFLCRSPEVVTRIILQQIPKYLDAAARKDIVSDVCAAIMARKILFDDLPTCAKPFVAAYNRMFDHFKTLSLDAPIAGTDLRRIALLEAECAA